ncbi:MAG: ribonuclease HII [Gammaproteobacteria bacterium]|nr:ribonuclease HII [Gammaproteobacteria bacterium]
MRDLFGEPDACANGIDVAGVDEVGRGPLAGPVVAGAVVLDPARKIKGLKDSKELTPDHREELAAAIRDRASAWALGRAEVVEIDRINILRATLVAMRRAIDALAPDVRVAYIDGNVAPSIGGCATVTVIGGDARVPSISAASIIAKVARDAEMVAAAARFPGYGFECHKGYATAMHLAALKKLGPTPLHRRSFAPVGDAGMQATLF